MKCGNCFLEFEFENEKEVGCYHDDEVEVLIYNYECPHCERPNLKYVAFKIEDHGGTFMPLWPPTDHPPCPLEVPAHIAEDYREACLVLPFSPKASAALSRRCLQNLLHNAAGVRPDKLAKEIEEVISSGKLPSQITESIQAIRHIGNFAAHPDENRNTGEIMPVEPHEAEWSLDILESLFDFYYVLPARNAQKRAALNAKFQEAGKQPPMK